MTMTTQPLKIGFIGLGIMGAPMAGHLLAAGHKLFVRTRSKVPDAISAAGARSTLRVPAWDSSGRTTSLAVHVFSISPALVFPLRIIDKKKSPPKDAAGGLAAQIPQHLAFAGAAAGAEERDSPHAGAVAQQEAARPRGPQQRARAEARQVSGGER